MKFVKYFLILIVIINTIGFHAPVQSRKDDRRFTRLPVNVIVDKTSADGNWMKVYEIGGGMSDDLITEMFISNESGINTDELDRLDLVAQYQLLFGLSEMVPHGLITTVAEQQAKELEMANWELVSTPQIQGEDCLMPGGNTPPAWPQDMVLPTCLILEPQPEPIGKEPTPPSDGKPIPDPYCWSEVKANWGFIFWIVYGKYECYNFKGSFEFEDWANGMSFHTNVMNGTLNLTLGFRTAGIWVYLLQGKNSPMTEEGEYYWNSGSSNKWHGSEIRKIKVYGNPSPETYYNWRLSINKTSVLSTLNPNFLYPSWPCVVDDSIPKPDDYNPWLYGC